MYTLKTEIKDEQQYEAPNNTAYTFKKPSSSRKQKLPKYRAIGRTRKRWTHHIRQRQHNIHYNRHVCSRYWSVCEVVLVPCVVRAVVAGAVVCVGCAYAERVRVTAMLVWLR